MIDHIPIQISTFSLSLPQSQSIIRQIGLAAKLSYSSPVSSAFGPTSYPTPSTCASEYQTPVTLTPSALSESANVPIHSGSDRSNVPPNSNTSRAQSGGVASGINPRPTGQQDVQRFGRTLGRSGPGQRRRLEQGQEHSRTPELLAPAQTPVPTISELGALPTGLPGTPVPRARPGEVNAAEMSAMPMLAAPPGREAILTRGVLAAPVSTALAPTASSGSAAPFLPGWLQENEKERLYLHAARESHTNQALDAAWRAGHRYDVAPLYSASLSPEEEKSRLFHRARDQVRAFQETFADGGYPYPDPHAYSQATFAFGNTTRANATYTNSESLCLNADPAYHPSQSSPAYTSTEGPFPNASGVGTTFGLGNPATTTTTATSATSTVAASSVHHQPLLSGQDSASSFTSSTRSTRAPTSVITSFSTPSSTVASTPISGPNASDPWSSVSGSLSASATGAGKQSEQVRTFLHAQRQVAQVQGIDRAPRLPPEKQQRPTSTSSTPGQVPKSNSAPEKPVPVPAISGSYVPHVNLSAFTGSPSPSSYNQTSSPPHGRPRQHAIAGGAGHSDPCSPSLSSSGSTPTDVAVPNASSDVDTANVLHDRVTALSLGPDQTNSPPHPPERTS